MGFCHEIRSNDGRRILPVSEAMFHVLSRADGIKPLRSLLPVGGGRPELLDNEVHELWSRRAIVLRPQAR